MPLIQLHLFRNVIYNPNIHLIVYPLIIKHRMDHFSKMSTFFIFGHFTNKVIVSYSPISKSRRDIVHLKAVNGGGNELK